MKLLPIRDARIKLLLLSLMHFATDGLCAYLIFTRLYPENPGLSFAVFIGYNLLAFVTQSPIGMIIDKYNRPKLFLGVSAVSVILGYLFSGVCFVSVLFIGLGNSLFHVAGGKYVTDKSGNDVSHLGVFVSTGAIGLAIGQIFFDTPSVLYLFFLVLIGCTLIMLASEDSEKVEYAEKYEPHGVVAIIALMAVVAVVFIRSFVGKVAVADFELTKVLVLVISAATALGKAVGGFASKLFGTVPTVVTSMGVAAVCLTLGCSNPYIYILGIFVFNFSMPMTLYYANILLKGKEGFAFGTLAAVLMPGYLMAMTVSFSLWIKILVAVLCFLSAFAVAAVSRGIKNADRVTSDTTD